MVPVTAPALEERVELPAERAVEELPPSELLSLERVTTPLPEERVAELLPERAVPLLELLLPLSCRAEEVPPLERVVLPVERAEEELPEERVELLPELDRVMMWEPDVEVVDAEATLLENGDVYIKVIIEVTINEGA